MSTPTQAPEAPADAASPDGEVTPIAVVEGPAEGMSWLSRDAAERLPLRDTEHDAHDGAPEPDTSAFRRPARSGLEEATRVVPPELRRLRGAGIDAEDGQPEPDTSAFRRPNPPSDDASRKLLQPPRGGRSGSNLEPLLAIPVLEVSPALRAAHRAEAPPVEAPPPGPPVLPRYTVGSSPGPKQRCSTCKGALRVVRSTHEERLDATWFRFEWLDVERGWGDCPTHPTFATEPLERPAFLPAGRIGNGVLAWIVTWRWHDHMPGHEILDLLHAYGLRPTETHLARWLAQAQAVLAPVAAAVRAEVEGEPDERGIQVNDGRTSGRMRGRTGKKGVAFDWKAEEPPTVGDGPRERARQVLLDMRGWSRVGRQAILARKLAMLAATDPQAGPRLAWRAEELRRAADGAAEQAAWNALLDGIEAMAECGLPAYRATTLVLQEGGDSMLRFDAKGKPRPDLPVPENARHKLPAWYASTGDGGPQAMADAYTITESCRALGLPVWPYLRDLYTAAAEQGEALQPARWTPAARA